MKKLVNLSLAIFLLATLAPALTGAEPSESIQNCVNLKTGKARYVKPTETKCRKGETLIKIVLPTESRTPSMILSGESPPKDFSDGKDGDFYIDSVQVKLFGPRKNGLWGSGISLKGAPGRTGASLLSGKGEPSKELGLQGDLYLDLTAQRIYGPKLSDKVWPAATISIQGSGLRVLNSFGTLTALKESVTAAAIGDAYLVAGDLYVWSGSSWVNAGAVRGPIGPIGPEGPKGPEGPTGPIGPQGRGLSILGFFNTAGELVAAVKNPALADTYLVAADLYIWNGSNWQNIGMVRGPTGPQGPIGLQGPAGVQGPAGIQGPQGATGATGATGPTGPTGATGATGRGLNILGSFTALTGTGSLTATITSPATGDPYLVNANLYIWNSPNWVLVGPVLGPQGPTGATGPTGPTGTTIIGYYGSFVETSTVTVTTSASAIPFSSTILANSISITSSSRITFANTGRYNLQYTLVLHNAAAGGTPERIVTVWLAQNGTAIPNSGKQTFIEKDRTLTLSSNFFVNVSNVSTDYIEIMILGNNTGVTLKYSAPSSPIPAIAAASVTVSQVSQ